MEKEDLNTSIQCKQPNATKVNNSEQKLRKNKMVETDVEKLKYNILLTNVFHSLGFARC